VSESAEWLIQLPDEEATINLGKALAEVFLVWPSPVLSVYLQGDLGTGKTTMSRGLLRALGHQGAVKSPTYTLVEQYDLDKQKVFHFDIYRLADPEELEYMGIRDFFEPEAGQRVLALIEWPEKGEGVLPAPDISLHLDVLGQGRQVRINLVSASCDENTKTILTSCLAKSLL